MHSKTLLKSMNRLVRSQDIQASTHLYAHRGLSPSPLINLASLSSVVELKVDVSITVLTYGKSIKTTYASYLRIVSP